VRPRLPDWLEVVQVNGLKVGDAQVDLRYRRRAHETRLEVLDVRGDLKIDKKRSWPEPSVVTAEVTASSA
jgi:hypothetical protein